MTDVDRHGRLLVGRGLVAFAAACRHVSRGPRPSSTGASRWSPITAVWSGPSIPCAASGLLAAVLSDRVAAAHEGDGDLLLLGSFAACPG